MKAEALLLSLFLLASCSSSAPTNEASSHQITSSSTSASKADDGSISIAFEASSLRISNNKQIEIIESESNDYSIENNLLCFQGESKSNFAFKIDFEAESIQVSFASIPTSRICIGVMNDAGFKLFNDMEINEKEASYSFAKTLPTDRLILQCEEIINVSSIRLRER